MSLTRNRREFVRDLVERLSGRQQEVEGPNPDPAEAPRAHQARRWTGSPNKP